MARIDRGKVLFIDLERTTLDNSLPSHPNRKFTKLAPTIPSLSTPRLCASEEGGPNKHMGSLYKRTGTQGKSRAAVFWRQEWSNQSSEGRRKI